MTTYVSQWLVLVPNRRWLSDFARQMARTQEFPRECPESGCAWIPRYETITPTHSSMYLEDDI